MDLEHIKLYCPFCGEEMIGDTHGEKNQICDNWICIGCKGNNKETVVFDPRNIFMLFEDEERDFLKKYYKEILQE